MPVGTGRTTTTTNTRKVGLAKSLRSKLGQASRTKRADTRRKQAAKATQETYLPLMWSLLASGSAGGGSAGGGSARGTEVVEMSGKERAQAARDFDRSRPASKSAEVLTKHQQLYTITRQRLLEERQAEDPDTGPCEHKCVPLFSATL